MSIVIIEDEADIAASVAARLRNEGFAVAIAADGPSGVELVRVDDRPDLVVLDLMLPGMDGLEVCRRIQADRAVPVVMLTARDDETDMLIGLGVGADDYLTKPFSPRELVARIRAILRRVERERAVAAAGAAGGARASGSCRSGTWSSTSTAAGCGWPPRRCTSPPPSSTSSPSSPPARAWSARRSSSSSRSGATPTAPGPRTVDSHVRDVRRKIGGERIRTVHGVGYALAEQAG